MIPTCRNGPACIYLRENRCKYEHKKEQEREEEKNNLKEEDKRKDNGTNEAKTNTNGESQPCQNKKYFLEKSHRSKKRWGDEEMAQKNHTANPWGSFY